MDSLCCDLMAERRFSIGYVVAPKKQQSFIQESLVDLAKSRDIDLVRIDTERSLVTEQMADLEDHRLFQKIPKRKQAARKLAPSKSRSARKVMNVFSGKCEDRAMMTGLHIVADIFCVGCGSIMGWKYETAHENGQKYKEGKSVLGRIKVSGPEGRIYWASHEAQVAENITNSDRECESMDSTNSDREQATPNPTSSNSWHP
ncbi:hypothetical protein ACFX15_037691 [Malus domestica]